MMSQNDITTSECDSNDISDPTKKNIATNNIARTAAENIRGFGVPARSAYYATKIPDATSNDQITADITIGNVIGNGAGLLVGLAIYALFHRYYRTGDHQLLNVTQDPSDPHTQLPPIEADGAYVRFRDQVYYVNNVTKAPPELLEIEREDALDKIDAIGKNHLKKSLNHLECKYIHGLFSGHRPCSSRTSTNPLYRNFKTLGNFGWQVGAWLSIYMGIQNPHLRKLLSCILSDICCLLFGLVAIPYWLIREKVLKINPGSKHRYAVTGSEGWSKYLRTALAFGIAVGQGLGGFFASVFANASASAVSFVISFWGGLVGMISFITGLIAVPLINWLTSRNYKLKFLSENEVIESTTVIPQKTILLKRNKDRITAYYVKQGKIYSVKLKLDSNKRNTLYQFFPGASLHLTTSPDAKLVDAVAAQCSLGALASDDKNFIRNNYTRSGMTLGAGLGACLGLLIGNWWLGIVLGGVIFSALGTVVGGVVFSLISHKLHRTMHSIPAGYQLYHVPDNERINFEYTPNKGRRIVFLQKQKNGNIAAFIKSHGKIELVKEALRLSLDEIEIIQNTNGIINNEKLLDTIYTQVEDIENSWDYATRSTAGVFGFIGAAVVCLINPAAALLLVPIGTAIAGAIGWGIGIIIMKQARALRIHEKKAETLPWTQRITAGANLGSIIGGIIGIIIGFVGFIFTGPASIILAVSFFSAIGAVVGGIVGALWEKRARELIVESFKNLFISPFHATNKKPSSSESSLQTSQQPSRNPSPGPLESQEIKEAQEGILFFGQQSPNSSCSRSPSPSPYYSNVNRFYFPQSSPQNALPFPTTVLATDQGNVSLAFFTNNGLHLGNEPDPQNTPSKSSSSEHLSNCSYFNS